MSKVNKVLADISHAVLHIDSQPAVQSYRTDECLPESYPAAAAAATLPCSGPGRHAAAQLIDDPSVMSASVCPSVCLSVISSPNLYQSVCMQ